MSKTLPGGLAPPLRSSNPPREKKHYLVRVSAPQDPQDSQQHQQHIQTESDGNLPSGSSDYKQHKSFREVLNSTVAGVLTLKGTEVESSTSKRDIGEEEDDRYEVMKFQGSKR
jgi:hypothetical protein